MQPEDMILVSVDDHLVEPPTLFAGKMPNQGAVARIDESEAQCLTHPRFA